MDDKEYILQVRQQMVVDEMETGKVPAHHVSDNDILYRKHYGDSVHQCVKQLS